MNPIDTVFRVTGIIRLVIGFLVLGIFAWGMFTAFAGQKAMSEIETEMTEVSTQFRQIQRQEMNDRVLAADGWGQSAHVDAPTTNVRGSIRQETIDMIDDHEGDWGYGAQ